jgi:hypothetical protein
MTAGVGVEAFASFPDAAARMTSIEGVVPARPELADLYTRRYTTYRELREGAIQFWLNQRPLDQPAVRAVN